MNCPNCGTTNPVGAMFCDHCGTSLAGGAPAGVPPTTLVAGVPPMGMPQAGPSPATNTCGQCGWPVMSGQAFCENCGYALGSAPPAGVQPAPPPAYGQPTPPPYSPPATPYTPPPVAQPAYVPPPAPYGQGAGGYGGAGGFVAPARVVIAGGAQVQLAGKTEYMIGREDAVSGNFPEVNLEPHGAQPSGVSRQHAKIVAQGGYFLEDLNSVNGTFLNKQKLLPGQRMPLNNGDEIRLGKLVMNFYTG